ncbi:MAG TPA: DUF2269 family protein [Solirubrobacterales bacterium]|nr:DUF2269 family protein [Solirubrobacterales bacterium]
MAAGVITFYWTVVFVHVVSVVVGFGPTFVYPILWRHARKSYPRSLPYMLHTMETIGKAVIGPASLLILLSGIYLVSDGPYDFSATFVQVALPIIVVLILAGPLYFGRSEGKLAELAERDIAASPPDGEVRLSDEFDALFRQVTVVARLASLAVLVALFFMVVKP